MSGLSRISGRNLHALQVEKIMITYLDNYLEILIQTQGYDLGNSCY